MANYRTSMMGYTNYRQSIASYYDTPQNGDRAYTETMPPQHDLSALVDFLNTVDLEDGPDHLADARSAAGWLARAGLLPKKASLNDRDAGRIRRFREDVRDLIDPGPDGPARRTTLRSLNRALAGIPLALQLDAHGASRIQPPPAEAQSPPQAVLARLAAIVHDAMHDGSWPRLKLCEAGTCRWAFLDASRNRSRQWCKMAVCGNRAKARRFRDRRRPTRSP